MQIYIDEDITIIRNPFSLPCFLDLPFSVMNMGMLLYLCIMYMIIFSIPSGNTKLSGIEVYKERFNW